MANTKENPKRSLGYIDTVVKKEYDISQRELIKVLGIPQTTYRGWCHRIPYNGNFKISTKSVLCLFALHFGEKVPLSQYFEKLKDYYIDWDNEQEEQLKKDLKVAQEEAGWDIELKSCVRKMKNFSDLIYERFPSIIKALEDENGKVHELEAKSDKSIADIHAEKMLNDKQKKLMETLIKKNVLDVNEERMNDSIWLYTLGLKFSIDEEVYERDLIVAFRCFDVSADLGYTNSMVMVADCYMEGDGCEQDIDQAISYYNKAANNESVEAFLKLGDIYIEKNDYSKAFQYYEKAAIRGNGKGLIILGKMYYFGEGIEKDLDKSFYYFKKAVEIFKTSHRKQYSKNDRALYLYTAYYCIAKIYREGCKTVKIDMSEVEYCLEKMEKYRQILNLDE